MFFLCLNRDNFFEYERIKGHHELFGNWVNQEVQIFVWQKKFFWVDAKTKKTRELIILNFLNTKLISKTKITINNFCLNNSVMDAWEMVITRSDEKSKTKRTIWEKNENKSFSNYKAKKNIIKIKDVLYLNNFLGLDLVHFYQKK